MQVAAPKRMHHFMLQVRNLRDVGTTFDRCRDAAVPITMELVEIDDDVWQVQTYQEASTWGHRTPAVPSAQPAEVA